ncbi:porin family protein [Ferruginibacter sp. SUN106]|uniref:porin family protein n=1 Tax=Ferruginibacter sp. SUN106 TaxID=2978348 RepID=UPI003D35A116
MKKLITILAGIVLSASAFAQLSIGVHGTGNLSSAALNTDNFIHPVKKARVLSGAGIVVNFAASEKVSLRSGINFLQHGVKITNSIESDPGNGFTIIKFEGTTDLNYLQVPVNILYTIPVNNFQLFAGGGPYCSFGISGKVKSTTTTIFNGTTEIIKSEQDAFKKEADNGAGFKRADYGVGAVAGIMLPNRLYGNIGYQLSFANIDDEEGGKYKNRGLQLTIGYFFQGRK